MSRTSQLVRATYGAKRPRNLNVSGGSDIHRMLLTSNSRDGSVDPRQQVVEMRKRVHGHHDPGRAWESLWQDGIIPWDLGGPTEALISEVQAKGIDPKWTLIPGCGSGHELELLGRYLDDARYQPVGHSDSHTIIGLEISTSSLQKAQEVLEDSLISDGPIATEIILCEGDFFAAPSTWNAVWETESSKKAGPSSPLVGNQAFDFIFDYTFFCAIPPNLRGAWGDQMARLLAPNGSLLTIMFPYTSTSRATAGNIQGPPYAVSLKAYQSELDRHGLSLDTALPYATLDTPPKRQGQEVVGWWSAKDARACSTNVASRSISRV